jgi:recombination protein RecT
MTTQTSQVPARTGKRDIMTLLEDPEVRKKLGDVSTDYLTPDRLCRIAASMIKRTPALQQCDPMSLLSALMTCSQAGLEPDGRYAHLIPYKDQVQVIFDYKGLILMAGRNGVKNVRAQSICENDQFTYEVIDGLTKMRHTIDWKQPRGKAMAYYSTCERDGQCDVEVMTLEEVEAVRSRSRAGGNGPWKTDYGEMCKKTVVRRHSKRWPLLAEASGEDDDIPADRFTPKAPEFAKPLRNSSMDFLEQPAGSLTGAPMAVEDEKELADAGLAPEKSDTPEHDTFEDWMYSKGILYSQLKELAVKEKLYEYAESFESLRELPVAVIRRLEKMNEGIVAGVKVVKV